MKILMVGMGVIGTIYGWAFSEAGIDITHIVRKGKKTKFEDGIAIDVYDLREGHPESQNTLYQPEVIEELSPEDGFELIIVATKHYQAIEAVRELKDIIPSATFSCLPQTGKVRRRLISFYHDHSIYGVMQHPREDIQATY
jgi:2-dehydropantoate 2-reductase